MIDHDHAWVMGISLANEWRNRGVGSSLLESLERRLGDRGVRRISCLSSSDSEVGAAALAHRGFQVRTGMRLYEKVNMTSGTDGEVLGQLGGRRVRDGLWEALGGMKAEKEIVERRVILPLANAAIADRLGVVPPAGIVLFGPPGTGKTSFAMGIASRLRWPFVELFPSRLSAGVPGGLATALRASFELLAELEHVVVFIDEVEEIASMRASGSGAIANGVTNEMLKLIPRFREQDGRLLVCATNSIRDLDSAFLRHGRFDYVVPIGPPDADARAAIWRRYLTSMPHQGVDVDAIVAASDMFTPADIEFAARRAAQAVFEGAVLDDGPETVTTLSILNAIERTRPTLSPSICASFNDAINEFARL